MNHYTYAELLNEQLCVQDFLGTRTGIDQRLAHDLSILLENITRQSEAVLESQNLLVCHSGLQEILNDVNRSGLNLTIVGLWHYNQEVTRLREKVKA